MAETETEDLVKADNLIVKLAKIGDQIGKLAKTGKNAGYNGYDFIEYSVVAGKIRSLFAGHRVLIIPEVVSYEKEQISSKQGAIGYHYNLTMKFTVVNGDNPSDKFESPWLSEANDYGDKGVNKAITAGTKYFIMRLFNISEKGDDPDAETVQAVTTRPTSGAKKATEKQLGYLAVLLKKLNLPQEQFNDTMKKAEDAKACATYIEEAQKRLGEGEGQ